MSDKKYLDHCKKMLDQAERKGELSVASHYSRKIVEIEEMIRFKASDN